MFVHFVTDEPNKIPAIRAMLEPRYRVVSELLGGGDTQIESDCVLMVDADLRKMVRVEQVRLVLQQLSCIREKVFVVPDHVAVMVAQAYALGATAVVARPREIVFKLMQLEIAQKNSDCANSAPETTNSAAALESMFSVLRLGKQIRISDAENVTSQIVDGVSQHGLTAWLDNVRRYHEGTFQHCLMVTGVAVAFALDMRFASQDVMRLGIAATLHDVGKVHIPKSILDKPGQLDPSEELIMRRHPMIGYQLLKDIPDISPEVLDGVKHHHEYLDGSGYPNALMAPGISDLVRLLTISDIFAALIESRPYRPTLTRQKAYRILCGMNGKLERSLIKAFRNVALVA
jgi:putative nucleotidyltransferase with HDIG domain